MDIKEIVIYKLEEVVNRTTLSLSNLKYLNFCVLIYLFIITSIIPLFLQFVIIYLYQNLLNVFSFILPYICFILLILSPIVLFLCFTNYLLLPIGLVLFIFYIFSGFFFSISNFISQYFSPIIFPFIIYICINKYLDRFDFISSLSQIEQDLQEDRILYQKPLIINTPPGPYLFTDYVDGINKRKKTKVIDVMESGPRSIILYHLYQRVKNNLGNKRPIDLVVASSIGGVIPLLDIYDKCSYDNVNHFTQYLDKSGLWNTRHYNSTDKVKVDLPPNFNNSPKLFLKSNSRSKKVVIVGSILKNSNSSKQDLLVKPYLFKSYKIINNRSGFNRYKHEHSTLERAIDACWSIPHYKEPLFMDNYRIIEGSLIASNPLEVALHEAKAIWPDHPLLIYSLGTGRAAPNEKLELPKRYSPAIDQPLPLNGTVDDLYLLNTLQHLRFEDWIYHIKTKAKRDIIYERVEVDFGHGFDDDELDDKKREYIKKIIESHPILQSPE